MDKNSEALTGFVATFIMIEVIVVFAVIAFMIWLYWRIFAKAGYNGTMSLLNLIPGMGQLICLLILAFGRWPIEDQLAAGVPPHIGPGGPGGVGSSPGTSVMPTS